MRPGSMVFRLKQQRKSQRLELDSKVAIPQPVKWLGVVGEYRIDRGPGYRVYLAKDGPDLVILLGGGTKKRQSRDIERARALWSEYKARKATASRAKEKR
jgi:putative addiction module killer protein